MVKMRSNLAVLLADLSPVLTSSGEDEFKFGRSIPVSPEAEIYSPSTAI